MLHLGESTKVIDSFGTEKEVCACRSGGQAHKQLTKAEMGVRLLRGRTHPPRMLARMGRRTEKKIHLQRLSLLAFSILPPEV